MTKSGDDIKELLDNCTYKYTMLNHAYGMKFSSKSNNCSIFLPAAQYRWDCHIDYDLFSCGYYWSSTLYPNYSGHSYCFFIPNRSLEQFENNLKQMLTQFLMVAIRKLPLQLYLNQ